MEQKPSNEIQTNEVNIQNEENKINDEENNINNNKINEIFSKYHKNDTFMESKENINKINSDINQNVNNIPQQPQQEETKKYKSIIELQKEINYYKNKERIYKLQLIEKQKKINELKELKSYYENIKKSHKEAPPNLFRKDQIFDVKTQKLLLALKKIIEDKNSSK